MAKDTALTLDLIHHTRQALSGIYETIRLKFIESTNAYIASCQKTLGENELIPELAWPRPKSNDIWVKHQIHQERMANLRKYFTFEKVAFDEKYLNAEEIASADLRWPDDAKMREYALKNVFNRKMLRTAIIIPQKKLKEIVEMEAKAYAQRVTESFITKLAMKMEIHAQKSGLTLDLSKGVTHEGNIWNGSVVTYQTTTVPVRWATKTILNYSVLGKAFNQWPTRLLK